MSKLGTITKYQRAKIRTNLRAIYGRASEEQRESGKAWYKEANNICTELSNELGYDSGTVASVLSALSPRNKWERNIIDTRVVLEAVRLDKKPAEVRVCTFNTNKVKAFDIAQGKLQITDTSRKTNAFVKNIANLDEARVTIDVWHLRACFGKTITGGLTPLRYDIIEQITLDEAHKVGLKGYEYQAIIWETIKSWKDINKI